MEVQLNATVNGKALWANPKSTAAKAYGIAKCVNLNGFAYYTAVRFPK